MTNIAFIGLGSMGMPMAINLSRKNFVVAGFDVRAAAREEFAHAGGRTASSVGDAFAGADLAILMVVNADQAESALFDSNAISRLTPDATIVVMATCPPARMGALATRVKAAGLAFVDAPVSGGMVGAQNASLTIMAAGADQDVRKARPALEAMGSKIVHVGREPGQGSTAKAVNQLLCGVHLAAAAEAMALARRLGVNMDEMLDIVAGSSASSWMLRDRGPRMLQSEPPITSVVDIFLKDLGIVVETSEAAGADTPLARAAYEKFAAASAAGFGGLDDSQVIRAFLGTKRTK